MRIFSPRLSWVRLLIRRRLALHLADGSIEHLGIELEADGFDMSALLAAEQISRAAQFQIKRRDFEARAQIGKFFQRRQSSARDRRQFESCGTAR